MAVNIYHVFDTKALCSSHIYAASSISATQSIRCLQLMNETTHTVLALDAYNDKICHLIDSMVDGGAHTCARRIQFYRIDIKNNFRLEGPLFRISDLVRNPPFP